jgi:LacI family transcriptional regulator
MADLGYEVDVTAQSMRAGRSRLVACAIRDFDIPRFALFIKEAEAVLREAGYTLLLASTTNRPDVEIDLLGAFRRRRVDGVMMTLSDEQHRDVREALSEAPMPVLLIDRDSIAALDRVMADHREGARLATNHLIGLGHRRIAMLVGDTKAFPSRSRLDGFREAYSAAGIAPDPKLLRDNVLSSEDAYRATASLMSLANPPTALFVAAMDMLGGCLRALRTMSIAVGDGISVVAGSDSDLAELHTPPITCGHGPPRRDHAAGADARRRDRARPWSHRADGADHSRVEPASCELSLLRRGRIRSWPKLATRLSSQAPAAIPMR